MKRVFGWLLRSLIIVGALAGCGHSSPVNPTPTPIQATAPQITVQPTSQTLNAGQVATFGVTATGTAPLQYQWQ
jgi:predicted small lipoprotein YifL